MRDFLRWFAELRLNADIGEAVMEASTKARIFGEEGYTFSGGSVFRPPDFNPSPKPGIDLPVDIQTVKVSTYGPDNELLGTRLETRLVRQSEISIPVGYPGEEYTKAESPAQRAFLRALKDGFDTYHPEPCPWEGALVGLWHAGQRACNSKLEDKHQMEENSKLILEAGNSLRELSRACGDSDNILVRKAIRRVSSAEDPISTLRDIRDENISWHKKANNWVCPECHAPTNEPDLVMGCHKKLPVTEETLIEAASAFEELCHATGMTVDDVRRLGVLRLHDGRLIHYRNVVKKMRIDNEGLIIIGETAPDDDSDDPGETGVIQSYDVAMDQEIDTAQQEQAERAAERRMLGYGKNAIPIPVLLKSEIRRPAEAVEAQEFVYTWVFDEILSDGTVQKHTIEGSIAKAYTIHDRMAAAGHQVGNITAKTYPTWCVSVFDGYSQTSWDFIHSGTEFVPRQVLELVKNRIIRTKEEAINYQRFGSPKREPFPDIHDLLKAHLFLKSEISDKPLGYIRSFGGFWSRRSDGTFVKSHGISPKMEPLDTSGVDDLGVLRTIEKGSGFYSSDLGSDIETEGNITLVIPPDWMMRNVEFGVGMNEMIARIDAIGADGPRDSSIEKQIRKDIEAQFWLNHKQHRFLRGRLTAKIRDVMKKEALTPEMAEAIAPLAGATFSTFHQLRQDCQKRLVDLSKAERAFAWAFMNCLQEELLTLAIQAVDKARSESDMKDYIRLFAKLRKEVRLLEITEFARFNRRMANDYRSLPTWAIFLLRDELVKRRMLLNKRLKENSGT